MDSVLIVSVRIRGDSKLGIGTELAANSTHFAALLALNKFTHQLFPTLESLGTSADQAIKLFFDQFDEAKMKNLHPYWVNFVNRAQSGDIAPWELLDALENVFYTSLQNKDNPCIQFEAPDYFPYANSINAGSAEDRAFATSRNTYLHLPALELRFSEANTVAMVQWRWITTIRKLIFQSWQRFIDTVIVPLEDPQTNVSAFLLSSFDRTQDQPLKIIGELFEAVKKINTVTLAKDALNAFSENPSEPRAKRSFATRLRDDLAQCAEPQKAKEALDTLSHLINDCTADITREFAVVQQKLLSVRHNLTPPLESVEPIRLIFKPGKCAQQRREEYGARQQQNLFLQITRQRSRSLGTPSPTYPKL